MNRSWTLSTLFLILCAFWILSIGSAGYAQRSDGYWSGDGIEGGVVPDDTTASLAGLTAWWKANSGIEMGDHEARNGQCKKVVGFRFDFGCSWDIGDYTMEGESTDDAHIFYCAEDIYGEKITLNSPPVETTNIYWSFQATVFYECDVSGMSLSADPGSIDVGEDSTVEINVTCEDADGVDGMTVNLWLSEGSPGSLDQHEVTSAGGGKATVTFHADAEGTATVNAQILVCSGTEQLQTVDASCTIEVGGRNLEVNVIYISEVSFGDFQFNSSFVNQSEIDLNTDITGYVTGSGQGRTSFDFEYTSEHVYSENWDDEGFTEVTAEGMYNSETEMYLLNIDITGSITYTHVVDLGTERREFPIQEDIDWDQLLAEPILIGAAPDSIFSASGDLGFGLQYVIIASWVSGSD